METRTFLLELHCEEIPARFLSPLCMDFQINKFGKLLIDNGLILSWDLHAGIQYHTHFYSPRKLAWLYPQISVVQPDRSSDEPGPPQRMCVGEDGKPTIQGLKFAEKWGVNFSAVRFEQPAGKKEPCAVVTVTKKGRPTKELLAEALPGLIAGLHVPKAMRWGSSEFEFVRPIRNVLCLFGEEVVDFTVDGVRSGNTTWGNRLHHRQHPEPVVVTRPEDYETALKDAGIVVSFADRRNAMEEQLKDLAEKVHGTFVADDLLLDTLAEIVEVPKIVRGDFPAGFLELPKEVLVTSLAEHQKAFCIEDAEGKLLPHFLTAANRADDPKGFVKSGNEWVLKARLYDARFFFAEDQKHKLETRLDALKQLTFQKELGSYYDKTQRVMALAERLAGLLGLDAGHAKEAARLAKCDLRTLMVGEFPELQGIMGGEYLQREGAPEVVWKAVKEHYRPAGADDAIPSTDMGSLLSIADKLDTVAGCFSVGLIPTGSKDPLALRRAGQGIVRTMWDQGWSELTLGNAMDFGRSGRVIHGDGDSLRISFEGFFKDRVSFQLEQTGYAGSVRRAAMEVGWTDLVDLKARCEALSAFADDARFASLAQSAKRIANILKDEAPASDYQMDMPYMSSEERGLVQSIRELNPSLPWPYEELLPRLASLSDELEAYFDKVMVKDPDPGIRGNRLAYLNTLRLTFLRVADFSQWQ